MKIAYFGFDLFYDCLEQIHKSGHNIIKIFTCKVDEVYEFSDKVRTFALENNIYLTDEKVTEHDIDMLIDDGCDMLFSAGYYFKIPVKDCITGVNIHPALLPFGRGPWPQPVTILKGLNESGVTLHKLSDKFDEGDIILQKKFQIDKNENLETITKKYAYYATDITREFFDSPEKILSLSYQQPKGEYWPEPTAEDMTFTDSDSAERIDKILRAFYGFKCFFNLNGKKITIRRGYFSYQTDQKNAYKTKDGFVVVSEYA